MNPNYSNYYRNPAGASQEYLFSMNNFQGIRPTANPPQNQYAPPPQNAVQNEYAPQVGFVFPGGGQWMPSGFNNNQPSSSGSTASSDQSGGQGGEPTQAAEAPKKKAPGWSEAETLELIEAWGDNYEKLKSSSKREKAKIWNCVYEKYTKAWGNSDRTLPQIKKRIQNLEYEFKNLKQKASSTGEEGIKKIKQSFPYYDTLDTIAGHRDNVDPNNMQLEGSSVFAESSEKSESEKSTSTSADSSDTPTNAGNKETPKTSKGKGPAKKGSRKRRRSDVDEEEKWEVKFMDVFERGMKEDNARFERCLEGFKESQKEQMNQTNEILAGFKDIFSALLSKKD